MYNVSELLVLSTWLELWQSQQEECFKLYFDSVPVTAEFSASSREKGSPEE